MNKSLRYISISHKKASVEQREKYHFSEEEKSKLVKLICNTFSDITGLFILVTCNRTEIFFESNITSAGALCDFLILLKEKEITEANKQLFDQSNDTEKTIIHLLEVSSGLLSSVLGDAEIIHQIKLAHQFSIAQKLQGSLLERAMQSVFKNHKRISNETHFRDGTTSVAYKSLKVISDIYKGTAKSKKILFIGAGEIVKQLFKYNRKFHFNNIYISNRTEQKAMVLSEENQCKVFGWNNVLTNDFQDFDVIISAASNNFHLIKKIPATDKKVLLIDLAIPENIDKTLGQNENILIYNLEAISADLEDTRETRMAAIDNVKTIINEELLAYKKWLQEAPKRAFMANFKILVHKKVSGFLVSDTGDIDDFATKTYTDEIMRKLMKKENKLLYSKNLEEMIDEQISLLTEMCI